MKGKIMEYSLFTLVTIMVSCSPVRTLRKLQPVAKVDYTEDELNARRQFAKEDTVRQDTMKRAITYTRSDGSTAFLTESVFDSVSNSSVSMVYVPQVTISARSLRRVAERNGKIHVDFQMIVPTELQRTSWQVNLQPMMCRDDGKTDSLEAVLLTGERFRAGQYKDYVRYDHYLQQIIPDTADFFNSFVRRRAYLNYTKGLFRRRTYLEELMQKSYQSRRSPLIDRFELFNRLNLRKNFVYEAKIVRQQQLISFRKNQKEEPRSLYRLGGWSPFRHYSWMRHTNEVIQRDTLSWIAKQQSLAEALAQLARIDSAEIVKRFANHQKIEKNRQRIENKERMFAKMVPRPFKRDLRLDSVVNLCDTLRYFYSQEVEADENTSKLHIYLKGSLVKRRGAFYQFSSPDTLHFNVSSMTTFVDEAPRYVQRIITRDAEANARFQIGFPKGKSSLNEQFGENVKELKKVKEMIGKLMNDPVYIIDSIKITATSSPEGSLSVNKRFARERSVAFSELMKRELDFWRDSLNVENTVEVNEDGTTNIHKAKEHLPDLTGKIRIESIAEDWNKLAQLVAANDSALKQGDEIVKMIAAIAQPDRREMAIRKVYPADYAVMRAELYPMLRAVEVKFNLLRRGMQQDTIYTTELDSTYAEGVRLLKAHRYTAALGILQGYSDVNTALAYMSLGYDDAALRIFREQKPTDNILYSMAVLYARKGDDANAVQQLMKAVELTPRLRFRGNLDPEIAVLIKRYNLFADE